MNIKTIQRSAAKVGLRVIQEWNAEFQDYDYYIFDSAGKQIAGTNSKKELAAFIEWYITD